jgi:acetoin utilization protein AcuB
MYEVAHLLSEIKVRDIMTANPLRINSRDTVERAAAIMRDNKVGGLPVVDEDDKVVGILTETDIFRFFTMVSGVDMGGIQLAARLSVQKGTLKQLIDDLRAQEARIVSIYSHLDPADETRRTVYIRILPVTEAEEYRIKGAIEASHQLLYWVKD